MAEDGGADGYRICGVSVSGKFARGALRFWLGTSSALIFCPLIIGWVTKAMETISRETMGLPPEYQVWTTITVVIVALLMCTLSGLWGIVYADFFLFIVATLGTTTLAIMSVPRWRSACDGGKLSAMHNWTGHDLNIAPSIGSGLPYFPMFGMRLEFRDIVGDGGGKRRLPGSAVACMQG